MPDTTMTLRSLLRTAQNLAECHTQLAAEHDIDAGLSGRSEASGEKKRKNGAEGSNLGALDESHR